MAFRSVTIHILEGRDLSPVDRGSADPFVRVSIGGDRKLTAETPHLIRTVNPVWNCKIELSPVYIFNTPKKATHPYNEVRLAVWDWNRIMSDKHMGLAYVKIDPNWLDGEKIEQWVDLKEAPGNKGQIRIRLSTRRIYTEKQAKVLAKEILHWKKLHPGQQWSDPDFPPVPIPDKGVTQWKRIHELSNQPQLFAEKASSSDVVQGALGTCYLLGAMAIVATRPELIRPLFAGSNFEEGIFIIRLFIEGSWHFVVLDDQLPCGVNGNIRFGSCRDPHSFWVPLLEKAYAKLFRSYAIIEGGNTAEALLDLTGEGAETLKVEEDMFKRLMEDGRLEKMLKKWKKARFLMGVSRFVEGESPESESFQGILSGHAYSVLDIKNPVTDKGFLGMVGNKHTVLIKVRNPWGEKEWTGAWSDGSKEWTPALRKALKHTDADDGVFWMEMTDFFSVFNRFSVVRMYSHRFSVFDHKWHTFKFVSEWDEFSAGGCMNNDSWVKNPQYSLQVLDEKKGSTVFIYVSQPDRRFLHQEEYDVSIGCYVLRVDDASQKLTDRGKIRKQELVANAKNKNATFGSLLHDNGKEDAPTFINKRDVCLRLELAYGNYIIMPCTFEPGKSMAFSMGVFAESKVKCHEILTERSIGIVAEFEESTAGGPPEMGEIARSEKKKNVVAPYLQNPKVVLHWKSMRRVEDLFTITVRAEVRDCNCPFGLRLYKKTKPHQTQPLFEKNVIEEVAPSGTAELKVEFTLDKSKGPFCIVPFLAEKGTTGKVVISVTTDQPGLSLEQYY